METNLSDEANLNRSNSTFKSPPARMVLSRSKRKMETFENGADCAYKVMKNVCDNPDRDECALFGELLIKKLRSFDENTRDILMHEINNLVFRTKMQKRNPSIELVGSSSYSNDPFEGLGCDINSANRS